MIRVTRLDGTTAYLNPDLIQWIEASGDTVITFTDGKKLIVKETAEALSQQFIQAKKSFNGLAEINHS
jgi:flagellar protein FlbD